jgi:hypothetical protein
VSDELPEAERRARARLRAVLGLPSEPTWMPLEGLPPGGRNECRAGERPCRYVHCSHHLWLQLRSERTGTWGGRKGGTTLRAGWLEDPMPPSCALDVAESVPPGERLSFAELGRALGLAAESAQHAVGAAVRAAERAGLLVVVNGD